MPASRAAWSIAALAAIAFGGLTVIYVLFANPNTNRGLHLTVALDEKDLRDSALDILRKRCDAAGIVIKRMEAEGSDRIRIHASNPEDGPRLKDLVTKAGRLSLHETHTSMTAAEADGGRLPAGFGIYPSTPAQAGRHLLRIAPVVRGDELVDAQSALDSRTSEPLITFRLNAAGARKLGQFTQANIGRPLAIVIDDVVVSAPIVREPILGGTGQVSGNFAAGDAAALAIRLRSGALPAKLTIVEERVVTSDR